MNVNFYCTSQETKYELASYFLYFMWELDFGLPMPLLKKTEQWHQLKLSILPDQAHFPGL